MPKLSSLLQVGSLFYNFRSLKKKVKYQLKENCHKLKMQYPYPVPFSKKYFSNNKVNKKSGITAFQIMLLQKRTTLFGKL